MALAASIATGQEITVAAAADLAPLQADIQRNEPNLKIRFVISASAVLEQQIENGAPYDVFLSANAAYVDHLAQTGKIEPNSVVVYAHGRVGVLWRDGKSHPLSDLEADWVKSIALPNPKLAPYGAAAVKALQEAGLWDAVSKKAVYGENVRQAYQMFESGNADVVLTSASLLEGKAAAYLPVPVEQKAGIVAGTKLQNEASEFMRNLAGAHMQTMFLQRGFAKP